MSSPMINRIFAAACATPGEITAVASIVMNKRTLFVTVI
jgi:hypothetical protein